MIKRVIKKIKKKYSMSFHVKPILSLPIVNIGGDSMDSGNVYMEIFRADTVKPYVIYSAGIGDQINFEIDLLNKLKERNIKVELYAFDPTPKSLNFLSEQDLPENFHVLEYALSNKDEKLHFALPKTDGWISGSCADVNNDSRNLDFDNTIEVEGRTISSIMNELKHTKIDLLKMDIEGSEFDVLEKVLEEDIPITEMCIDFHDHMHKNGKARLKHILSLFEKKFSVFDVENKSHHICFIHK